MAMAFQFCRLCAEEFDIKVNLFADGDSKLAQSIYKYLSIKVDPSDILPVGVCENCRLSVQSFEEFAAKCSNAQVKLEALFKVNVLNNTLSYSSKYEDQDISTTVKEEADVSFSCDDNDGDDDDSIPISKYLKKTVESDQKLNPDYSFKPKKETKLQKDKLSNRGRKITSAILSLFKCFKCHICSEEFTKFQHLKRHTQKTHSTSFQITCVCGMILSSTTSVYHHVARHSSGKDYKCNHCGVIFPRRRLLERHIEQLSSEHYPYPCQQCSKRFISAVRLKAHAKKHLPYEVRCKYTCEICGSKHTSKTLLKIHIDIDHNNTNHAVCDICGRKFRSIGQMQSHRRTHTDKMMYQCPKCPKRLKTKTTLKKHLDCHGDTSYKCPKCPAVLNSQQTLRGHMVVHEDIRRYICALCEKSYKRKDALNYHMRRHTGYRPYTCLWCANTFVDNSNLRDHKKKVHRKELEEYEAIHGPPLVGQRHKNDGSKETKLIELIPKTKTSKKIIVLGKDLVQLGASEYLKI